MGSPPCVKVRMLLTYHLVPFTTVKGKKKGSAYQKVPVMLASGRQINDSYIIFKNLVPLLCDAPFDEAWQNRITYQLQPSIEAEMMSCSSDMRMMATKAFGMPGCVAFCAAPFLGPRMAKKIRKKHPDLPPSAEIGQEFSKIMGSNKFFDGNSPGQVDIAYYGTLYAFKWAGCKTAYAHLADSGLNEWWDRMEAVMPKVM